MVQWLRLQAFTAGDTGSIPCQGTKMAHTKQHGQKAKKKKSLVEISFECINIHADLPEKAKLV